MAELPAAREIIDRYMEVTGARHVVERTAFTHMKGTLGGSGKIEVWTAKPDKRVVRMEARGMVHPLGYDGAVAWEVHPGAGSMVLKGQRYLESKLDAAYDAVLKPDSLYENLVTVGREPFDGRDCYKVEVVATPLAGMDAEESLRYRVSYEFYEVESGLLAGTVGVSGMLGPEMELTTVFRDYRKFGSSLVASRKTLKIGTNVLEIVTLSLEYPEEIDDSRFALPDSIKALLTDEPVEKPAHEYRQGTW